MKQILSENDKKAEEAHKSAELSAAAEREAESEEDEALKKLRELLEGQKRIAS